MVLLGTPRNSVEVILEENSEETPDKTFEEFLGKIMLTSNEQ